MDLLFVEHQCGYNADGAANLGVEPVVVDATLQPRIAVPPGFDVSYSLSAAELNDDHFTDARIDGGGGFPIDPTSPGCYTLIVELTRGDLSGRFASTLDVADGGPAQCTTT